MFSRLERDVGEFFVSITNFRATFAFGVPCVRLQFLVLFKSLVIMDILCADYEQGPLSLDGDSITVCFEVGKAIDDVTAAEV